MKKSKEAVVLRPDMDSKVESEHLGHGTVDVVMEYEDLLPSLCVPVWHPRCRRCLWTEAVYGPGAARKLALDHKCDRRKKLL